MLRPPIAAASRNMSACSWHAVSHNGCRLMVASRAKMSRPRCPGSLAAARLLTFVRKASISECVDGATGVRPPLGLGALPLGSFDMKRAVPGRCCQRKVATLPRVRNGLCSGSPAYALRLLHKVVHFQRLFERGKPLRAGGGTPVSACVKRQSQRRDKARHL